MHTIPQLDRNGLRKFGFLIAVIVTFLFGLLLPWFRSQPFPVWPWIIAGILSTWAAIAPGTLAPIYHAWMKIGLLLGQINAYIVLGLVFYLLICPLGLLMRLFGRDTMARKYQNHLETYRIPSHPTPATHLRRPF